MNEDPLRKEIHDLRNELCKAQLRNDLTRMVLKKCPFGHADGKVRTHRATTEQELIAWLDELFELRDML